MLGVSPSAVSHQIRNFEALLDYKLFDRLDKRVELTSRGRQLYEDIREPLRQLHEASRKALRGHQDNSLTLSVAPVFATRWLLPRLKYFSQAHPEINVSMIATTDVVDLKADPIDAAIRLGDGQWSATVSEFLFSGQNVAVCHPSMLGEKGAVFDVLELSEQPLVHNSSMKGLWQEWFASAGLSVKHDVGGLQLQNSAQVLEAVQAGGSIGLVDRAFIQEELKQGKLVLANPHVLQGDDGFYLVYPEATSKLPAIELFRDWLFDQLEGE